MPSAASSSASKRAPITDAAFNVRLAGAVQPVDARLDGRLHRGRHAHLGDIRPTEVAAALTGQHPALGQLAHHLLGEERVPGGPLGDESRELAD